jgi:hypothetical protein
LHQVDLDKNRLHLLDLEKKRLHQLDLEKKNDIFENPIEVSSSDEECESSSCSESEEEDEDVPVENIKNVADISQQVITYKGEKFQEKEGEFNFWTSISTMKEPYEEIMSVCVIPDNKFKPRNPKKTSPHWFKKAIDHGKEVPNTWHPRAVLASIGTPENHCMRGILIMKSGTNSKSKLYPTLKNGHNPPMNSFMMCQIRKLMKDGKRLKKNGEYFFMYYK